MEYTEDVSMDTNGTTENKADEDERKIFVGGLSWESTDKDMKTYFEKFGVVEKVTLKTDNYTGESRGFGFIVYEDASSIDAVMAEQNHMLNGKKIGPRRANARPKPEPITKVFIGGLDPEVPETDIRAHFEQYGTILEIDLPMDKIANKRRAFAFVKFESEDIVNAIIASNDAQGKQTLAGKEVDIKKHTPKEQGGGRGRGRGGGFRGGRGAPRGRGGFGAPYGAPYGGYGGGYMDYSGYGGGYDYSGYGGGYDYTQDYTGAGYGGFGKAPAAGGRGRGARGRGRGFAPY